jgi:hypothetical protein
MASRVIGACQWSGVARRGDDDGVDVLAREDLPVVARGHDVRTPAFLRAFEPPVVDVGDGDQLHARNPRGHDRVARSHAARADQRDPDLVVRGDLHRLILSPSESLDPR